jgi:hypothetical protein
MLACVLDTASGTVRIIAAQAPTTIDGVEISPNGRWVAFSDPMPNPYGITEIYIYDLKTQKTTMLTTLPGYNGSPAWAPDPATACLAFTHSEQQSGDSIRLACLNRPGLSAPILPIGELPVWLPDLQHWPQRATIITQLARQLTSYATKRYGRGATPNNQECCCHKQSR